MIQFPALAALVLVASFLATDRALIAAAGHGASTPAIAALIEDRWLPSFADRWLAMLPEGNVDDRRGG